jgi:hypothetical protein
MGVFVKVGVVALLLAGLATAATYGRDKDARAIGAALPQRMPESKGKSFYVDGAKGTDAGPGTISRPWRTINYALRHVPLSGSTVLVRGGVYAGMVRFQRRGDPRNPVTLRPYPGEHVLLTASPPRSQTHAVVIYKASGFRVRGFEITAPQAHSGVMIESSDDIEITQCEVHHTGHSGILVAGTGSSPPTGNRNIQIWSNRFHDNGGDWISENAFWRIGDHSVYWGAVSSNNDGIDHTTYGGVIANNVFFNQPYGFQLQIGPQVSGLIVTNNTFYRATQAPPAGGAIVLYTESRTPAFVTRDVLVVNNMITYAANVGAYGSGGGGLMATNVVRDNLAFGNGKGDFLSFYGNPTNVLFQLGTNLTGRMPLFVSPRQLDFRLQPKSPAVGRADPAYATPIDFAGNRRDDKPDLGAFERAPVSSRK